MARLYYNIDNLENIKNVLVHDLIIKDENTEENIILSSIECEGDDTSGGRWKGVRINDIEYSNKKTVEMVKDIMKCGKIVNCLFTGDRIDDNKPASFDVRNATLISIVDNQNQKFENLSLICNAIKILDE